jgi:hypothetical protein
LDSAVLVAEEAARADQEVQPVYVSVGLTGKSRSGRSSATHAFADAGVADPTAYAARRFVRAAGS